MIKRLLIVEDDKTLSNGIALALKNDGFTLRQCHSLAMARTALSEQEFDLLLFDVNLPDGSGLDLLCEVKRRSGVAVIMLTAKDTELDIVIGLETGADDYITKPFSLAVLRARVHAQLRKSASSPAGSFEQDNFRFNFEKMQFFKFSTPIELSKTEQKLLRILVENKGLTVSRSTLVDRIWTDGADYVDENALSVTIKRLRDKLEDDPSKPKHIKTVYGVGYVWVVQ